MSQSESRTTRELFKEWRSGDAQAGQLMAQQVADWYYAISTSRLGESRGRGPCDEACAHFGQGVVEITESRQLIPWAHSLIAEQVKNVGTRATDGDEPSAYSGQRRPKSLLSSARRALPNEVELLLAVYGSDADRSQIDILATPLGGNPLGILEARYRVKRYLRDKKGVPFEVAPEKPVLDRAPLPLYEADRMANSQEEAQFEQWMLTDLELCKDIAEFAHFSIALRGGLPAASTGPDTAGTDNGPSVPMKPPPEAPAPTGKGGVPTVVIGVVVLVLLLAILGSLILAAYIVLT
ncbi:MAG: hypothetical protein AB8H79_07250 [Myxococcota bacterium]